MHEDEDPENTRLTQQDKINMLKELATFALVGLAILIFQFILPFIVRFIIKII